jgi:hypothetical protein
MLLSRKQGQLPRYHCEACLDRLDRLEFRIAWISFGIYSSAVFVVIYLAKYEIHMTSMRLEQIRCYSFPKNRGESRGIVKIYSPIMEESRLELTSNLGNASNFY